MKKITVLSMSGYIVLHITIPTDGSNRSIDTYSFESKEASIKYLANLIESKSDWPLSELGAKSERQKTINFLEANDYLPIDNQLVCQVNYSFNGTFSKSAITYEIGKVVKHNDKLGVCERGIHFCKNLMHVFKYYPFDIDRNTVYAKVVATGHVIHKQDKSVTDTLVVKELLNGTFDDFQFVLFGRFEHCKFVNGKLIFYSNHECKCWFSNGKYHRDDDLPTIERTKGGKKWYQNGLLHRANGLPAIIRDDGSKEWWVNGNRHREDNLPAVVDADGTKEWWVNDKRHRADGLPVIERADGTKV